MKELTACEIAYDQFLKNHEVFLKLNEHGHSDISYEMILLEICAAFYLLDEESKDQFFMNIEKIRNSLSCEIFEDEADFLDCVAKTMEEIRQPD